MNQVFNSIRDRRSVRGYLDEPIKREDVELLIDAAAWAPSAMNKQPVKFVVIENKSTLERLSKRIQELAAEKYPEYKLRDLDDPIFYGARLLVILCASEDSKWTEVDCALAAQNMMIAAHSMDYASCYIGFACLLEDEQEIRKELNIPDDHKIVAPLIFGKTSGDYPEPIIRKRPDILNWLE